MIHIEIQYVCESKELTEDLMMTLSNTINNFCVDHKQAFVVNHRAQLIGIPTEKK